MYKDDAPIRLIEMLGPWYGSGTTAIAPPEDLGPAFTLTWVDSGPPGDTSEKRTFRQYLYPDAVGGPAVHSPESTGWFEAPDALGTIIDGVISWSTTDEAKALRDLSTGQSTAEKATMGQPMGELAADSSTATSAVSARGPLGVALVIAAGLAAVLVWRRVSPRE